MITGRKNYFRIIFGGSTGKDCNSPGGYYITKFLGELFFECCNSPFRSRKNIRGNFLEPLFSVTSVVSGLAGGRVRGGGGGPVVSSWGWPLEDRNLASETALQEREIEIEIERDGNLATVTALPEGEREREREELGFCNSAARERERERKREELGFGNSTASALGGEDLRPGGGGWSLGAPSGRGGGQGPASAPAGLLGRGGALRPLTGTRGGLLQDRGSYRTGALTGQLLLGALQENPVIAPGQLHKNVYRIILVIISPQRVYFFRN